MTASGTIDCKRQGLKPYVHRQPWGERYASRIQAHTRIPTPVKGGGEHCRTLIIAVARIGNFTV